MKFAAFYYPGYYQCPKRNAAAGKTIDEWALLRAHPECVFTETDEIIPALGYTDASDPEELRREASLAATHGVDALIFNYYFDGHEEQLERPLYLFAANDMPVQFALNICAHMPKKKLPFGAGDTDTTSAFMMSETEFARLGERLARTFMQDSNYLRSKGRAVVTFYHVHAMLVLYGPAGVSERIRAFREGAAQSGVEIEAIGLFSVIGGWRRLPDKVTLPFDRYSCYVTLPDFESRSPVQSFHDLAQRWLSLLASERFDVPMIACIGAGWNATARGAPGYDPSKDGLVFPYHPIVVGDDAAAFGDYLSAVVRLSQSTPSFARDIVFLGPWNEWSEGCYLLPDQKHGLGRLQAIRDVKAACTSEDASSISPSSSDHQGR